MCSMTARPRRALATAITQSPCSSCLRASPCRTGSAAVRRRGSPFREGGLQAGQASPAVAPSTRAGSSRSAASMPPFSVLDLAPIPVGSTPAEALCNTLDLARHAERWGYTRYWLAEHHNMVGIASAATAVVIGYVAAGTTHIRVGAGGIMLPNHAPLIIAEQFGTLETLYPGRIDLGVGRAPGTDQRT